MSRKDDLLSGSLIGLPGDPSIKVVKTPNYINNVISYSTPENDRSISEEVVGDELVHVPEHLVTSANSEYPDTPGYVQGEQIVKSEGSHEHTKTSKLPIQSTPKNEVSLKKDGHSLNHADYASATRLEDNLKYQGHDFATQVAEVIAKYGGSSELSSLLVKGLNINTSDIKELHEELRHIISDPVTYLKTFGASGISRILDKGMGVYEDSKLLIEYIKAVQAKYAKGQDDAERSVNPLRDSLVTSNAVDNKIRIAPPVKIADRIENIRHETEIDLAENMQFEERLMLEELRKSDPTILRQKHVFWEEKQIWDKNLKSGYNYPSTPYSFLKNHDNPSYTSYNLHPSNVDSLKKSYDVSGYPYETKFDTWESWTPYTNVDNIFEVQDRLTADGLLTGYHTFAGFEIGSNHLWRLRLKPYIASDHHNGALSERMYPPPFPKYKVINPFTHITAYRDFGLDCPVLSYNFNMGSIRTESFRLFNSASHEVFAGVNFNMILTMSILDDVHSSMQKYMLKYMNFAYNPEAGTLRPFYELLFEIELIILKNGGQINHHYRLIGMPIDYAPTLEGNTDPNETRVDITMSIVGMIPYNANKLVLTTEPEFEHEDGGINWADIQSNMISGEKPNDYLN